MEVKIKTSTAAYIPTNINTDKSFGLTATSIDKGGFYFK